MMEEDSYFELRTARRFSTTLGSSNDFNEKDTCCWIEQIIQLLARRPNAGCTVRGAACLRSTHPRWLDNWVHKCINALTKAFLLSQIISFLKVFEDLALNEFFRSFGFLKPICPESSNNVQSKLRAIFTLKTISTQKSFNLLKKIIKRRQNKKLEISIHNRIN